MDALLCRAAAVIAASGGCTSPQGMLQDAARMSKRDANRFTQVGKALTDMPNMAGRLGAGAITLDNAKQLVDAAEQAGTEAVEADTALLDRAGQAPPDLFARDARRFAEANTPDRGESRLARQRSKRRLSMFTDDDPPRPASTVLAQ